MSWSARVDSGKNVVGARGSCGKGAIRDEIDDPKADINEREERSDKTKLSQRDNDSMNRPCQETFPWCRRKTKPNKWSCSDEQWCYGGG